MRSEISIKSPYFHHKPAIYASYTDIIETGQKKFCRKQKRAKTTDKAKNRRRFL
jgi:hypothetical protein